MRTPLASRHGAYRGFVDAAVAGGGVLLAGGPVASARGSSACAGRSSEDLFVLHFQPIVSLADGRVVAPRGAAAARRRPRRADRAGRVPAGGRAPRADRRDRPLVLERVDLAAGRSRWRRAAGGERGAEHLRAVGQRPLDGWRAGALSRRHGVEPSLLVLEITETAAIPDIDRASAFCAGVLGSAASSRSMTSAPATAAFQLPAAAALQLPEDRRRLHPPAARLAHRPADRDRPRGRRRGNGQPARRRVRRRPDDDRDPAGHRRGASPGLRAGAPGAAAGRSPHSAPSPGGVGSRAMSTTTAAPTLPDALGDAARAFLANPIGW